MARLVVSPLLLPPSLPRFFLPSLACSISIPHAISRSLINPALSIPHPHYGRLRTTALSSWSTKKHPDIFRLSKRPSYFRPTCIFFEVRLDLYGVNAASRRSTSLPPSFPPLPLPSLSPFLHTDPTRHPALFHRSSSLHPPTPLRPSVYYPDIVLVVTIRCIRTFCDYWNAFRIFDPTCIVLISGWNSTVRLRRLVVSPPSLPHSLPHSLFLSLYPSLPRSLHPDPSRHPALSYQSSSLHAPSAVRPSVCYPIIVLVVNIRCIRIFGDYLHVLRILDPTCIVSKSD